MNKTEIKLVGFGGQGIILMGYIIGKAVAIHENRFATFTQSYGPESRGGACSAKLIVSDSAIDYPDVVAPDILVAMSQEAYGKYAEELKPNGILIVEKDLVKQDSIRKDVKAFSVPATKLAEELGKKMTANIVMLGFFTATAKTVSDKAIREAIKTSVPPGTEELNLKAYQMGADYAKNKAV